MAESAGALDTQSTGGLFEAILQQLQRRESGGAFDQSRLDDLVGEQSPEALGEWVDVPVRGRTGMGSAADVPWIGLFPGGADSSAQTGIYVVYLFAKDGSAVFLCINQGTEKLRGGMGVLQKRRLDIRAAAGLDPVAEHRIALRSSNMRPRRYEAASAYTIEYRAGSVPSDEVLERDLRSVLAMASMAVESGLTFNPELEPTHLLFKWNAEVNARTVDVHQRIAEERGSVWWGRFARKAGSASVSETKVALMRDQAEAGLPTYAFLYRRGEVWRARIEEFTADRELVRGDDRLPSYYRVEDCNFFVRLRDFEELPAEWPISHLVLASDPDPSKITGALSNQTTPLFVYERFDPTAAAPAAVPPPEGDDAEDSEPLTLDWLVSESLLPAELLTEILEALDGRFPQVALAGPPGTGKSHLAELLARYLTQDQPLAYRVVQFHPSYTYEEFVQGLRPVAENNAINFKVTEGTVLDMVGEMQPGERRVLVMDEMNRANLPRVFGELMYLLEKRDTPLDLLYEKDFSLPRDLLFIGTMNTADRSIRSIDIALRRRFAIFDLRPSRAVLEAFYDPISSRSNSVPDLFDGFEQLNLDLTAELDRHHTIGHTFFMAEQFTHTLLEQVWRRQLRPLLEEYFFDQPDVAASFEVSAYWPSLNNAD